MRQSALVFFAVICVSAGTAFAESDIKVPTNVYLTAGQQRQMQRNGFNPTGDSQTSVATSPTQTYSGSGPVPVNVYLTSQQNRAQQSFAPASSNYVTGVPSNTYSGSGPVATDVYLTAAQTRAQGTQGIMPVGDSTVWLPKTQLTGSSIVTPGVKGAVVPYQTAQIQGVMENLNAAVSPAPQAVRAQFATAASTAAPVAQVNQITPIAINTGSGTSAYVVSIKPFTSPNGTPVRAAVVPYQAPVTPNSTPTPAGLKIQLPGSGTSDANLP